MSSSLPFFEVRQNVGPLVTEDDVQKLISDLTGAGWTMARTLSVFGWNDRDLRAIASISKGRIVSGQKGYALIEEVTIDEANHAAAWLESQARAMLMRAMEIRRAMHQRREGEAK